MRLRDMVAVILVCLLYSVIHIAPVPKGWIGTSKEPTDFGLIWCRKSICVRNQGHEEKDSRGVCVAFSKLFELSLGKYNIVLGRGPEVFTRGHIVLRYRQLFDDLSGHLFLFVKLVEDSNDNLTKRLSPFAVGLLSINNKLNEPSERKLFECRSLADVFEGDIGVESRVFRQSGSPTRAEPHHEGTIVSDKGLFGIIEGLSCNIGIPAGDCKLPLRENQGSLRLICRNSHLLKLAAVNPQSDSADNGENEINRKLQTFDPPKFTRQFLGGTVLVIAAVVGIFGNFILWWKWWSLWRCWWGIRVSLWALCWTIAYVSICHGMNLLQGIN